MNRALLLVALVGCGGDDAPRPVLRQVYVTFAGDATPTARVMQRRLDRLHVRGHARADDDRIVVELPQLSDARLASVDDVLSRTGALSFHVVDEGSAEMKAAYDRVRAEPSTPPALRAEIETWGGDTGDEYTDYYLLASSPEVITAALDGRIPYDRAVGLEERSSGEWRSYWMLAEPAIPDAKIVGARATDDRGVHVEVTFDAASADAFADLTGRLIGHKLAFVLDGRVTSAPIIASRITGGKAWITMGRDADVREADDLAIVLETGPLPGAVLLQSSEQLR